MNVLSMFIFCVATLGFTACSQTAGGDISTDTNISPTTNFQFNSNAGQQGIGSDRSENNNSNN